MTETAKNGQIIIDELIANGCDHFVIAAGSRSTPLTAAVGRASNTEQVVAYDERGAAFCALGYARATGRPAVVIVTSATAVANLLPAVIEASIDHLPLILLTADRPSELRHSSANQTIDQVKIFGDHVRHFLDLTCSDPHLKDAAIKSAIDYAVFKATHIPGPVQINCQFREPLSGEDPRHSGLDPESRAGESLGQEQVALKAGGGLDSSVRWNDKKTTYWFDSPKLSSVQLNHVAKILGHAENGLVVLGSIRSREEQQSVRALIEKLQWPVFADITSGLRFSTLTLPAPLKGEGNYDVVLQIGGRLVSKPLLQFLAALKPKRYLIVHPHPERLDPDMASTDQVITDLTWFGEEMANRVEPSLNHPTRQKLATQAALVDEAIANTIDQEPKLTEPFVARAISQNIESEMGLFVGTSMPVRDMNMFAATTRNVIHIAANRGASGIDGLISTAAGFALGLHKPTTLVIGDLSFVHDCNALSLLRHINVPLTIVLVNNQGGGIFSFLPIKKQADIFTPYFETPHEFCFEKLCAAFHVPYAKAQTKEAFVESYRRALSSNAHSVIEAVSDRQFNFEFHERIKENCIGRVNEFQRHPL